MNYSDFETQLTRQAKLSTAKWYVKTLKRMFTVIGTDIPTAEQVEEYLTNLRSEGRKGNYLNGLIMAIKRYGEYTKNPEYQNIKPYRKERTTKEILTIDEINALVSLEKPRTSNPEAHYRWSMFFKFLASFGLRAGECATLRVADIDLQNNLISIRDGKTGARKFPIPEALQSEIAEYIEARELDKNSHLFATRSGKLPTSGEWSQQFHHRLKRLGIDRPNLTVHSLRHSLISRLAKNSGDLFATMKLVGHRQPSTTMAYTHLNMEDVQRVLSKDPLCKVSEDSASQIIQRIDQKFDELQKMFEELQLALKK